MNKNKDYNPFHNFDEEEDAYNHIIIDINDANKIIQMLQWFTLNISEVEKRIEPENPYIFGIIQNGNFVEYELPDDSPLSEYYNRMLNKNVFYFFGEIAQNEKIQPHLLEYVKVLNGEIWMDEELPFGLQEAFALAFGNKRYITDFAKYLHSNDLDHETCQGFIIDMLVKKWGKCTEILNLIAARGILLGQNGLYQIQELAEKMNINVYGDEQIEFINYMLIHNKIAEGDGILFGYTLEKIGYSIGEYEEEEKQEAWYHTIKKLTESAEEGKTQNLEGFFYAMAIQNGKETQIPKLESNAFTATYLDLSEINITELAYEKADALLSVLQDQHLDKVQKAVKFYMQTMVAKLLNKDTQQFEEALDKALAEPIEFDGAWYFSRLNDWLEEAELSNDNVKYLSQISKKIQA